MAGIKIKHSSTVSANDFFLNEFSRLNDSSTRSLATSRLQNYVQEKLTAEQVPTMLRCMHRSVKPNGGKPSGRKECVRLLAYACAVAGRQVSRYLKRIVASVLHYSGDKDSTVRDACGDAISAAVKPLLARNSKQGDPNAFADAVLEPIFECMVGKGKREQGTDG